MIDLKPFTKGTDNQKMWAEKLRLAKIPQFECLLKVGIPVEARKDSRLKSDYDIAHGFIKAAATSTIAADWIKHRDSDALGFAFAMAERALTTNAPTDVVQSVLRSMDFLSPKDNAPGHYLIFRKEMDDFLESERAEMEEEKKGLPLLNVVISARAVKGAEKRLKPWLARISGFDERYGFKREFLKRELDGEMSKEDREYKVKFVVTIPGVYEYRNMELFSIQNSFCEVDEAGKTSHIERDDVRNIIENKGYHNNNYLEL